MPRSPSERRPVFRVFVAYGGRANPREFHVQAATLGAAARDGLALARTARLARPHRIDGVIHLFDLDHPPRLRGRAS